MANPYSNYFVSPGAQPAGTQAYGASAGPGYHAAGGPPASAAQASYESTAYPNTAAFAGYYGLAAKPNYEPPKNYFHGPPGPSKHDGTGLGPAHYHGYEAALYNAAQVYLHQQAGPKSGPMGAGAGQLNGSGNKGPAWLGGPGVPSTRRGRYFNYPGGSANQRRGSSSSTQQLHYCEVCKISCASPQTYQDHLGGQKHKKKEAAVRTGLPTVPTPRTGAALHCELCNVTCTSTDAYAAHIRGTKHQKVVNLHTKLGKPIPPAEPQLIQNSKGAGAPPSGGTTGAGAAAAPAAVVSGTPKINFQGGSFLHTTQPKTDSGENATASANQTKAEMPMNAAAATETAVSVMAQWEEEKVIQPVGQDYVEELHGPDGKITGFNCRLCDCRFNDVNAKDMHLKGRRHRIMYKKKVDPNLVVEAKVWTAQHQKTKAATWQDRRKGDGYMEGEAYEDLPPGGPFMDDMQSRLPAYRAGPLSRGMRPLHGAHGMGMPPPLQFFPAGPSPIGMPSPVMRRPDTNDDKHVLAKHAEIYPSDAELEAVQTLVSYVERALKLVSDQLTNQPSETTKEATSDEPAVQSTSVPAAAAAPAGAQAQRMLKGVMRVGLLAKGLLLKGDHDVQLVVLCSQPPTLPLLDRVTAALPTHLATVATTVTFSVEPKPDQACVLVTATHGHGLTGDVLVKVSLTSPVVREEQLAAAAATALINGNTDVDMKEAIANKDDRLNTKDCLYALALLRRAKWFQARANSLQNCVLVIRILRDFCLRSPAWSNVDFWALELIVERAIVSAGAPLSPGEALRRVFETISAGILLPPENGWGPGISDPCEKDSIDACANLTAQERENITGSAQLALRQIAFRQIYKVLGMAEPLQSTKRNLKPNGPSPGQKRPRENSQGDTVSLESEIRADLKKEKIEDKDA